MKTIVVSAPGKLHILGEHAVVYGKPAILAAINKRCTVKLTLRRDDTIKINSIDTSSFRHSEKPSPHPSPLRRGRKGASLSPWEMKKKNSLSPWERARVRVDSGLASMTGEQILKQTQKARKAWERYRKTSDIELLKAITKRPLDYIVIAIGEALMYYDKNFAGGFNLEIHSEIPTGAGLGSSAAIAVAIAGTVSLLFRKTLDREAVNEIAYLSEQKKHGFPSGGDNSASYVGGLIWYRKETPDLKIIKPIPFSFPQKLAKNFVAIHTGIPSESTGEMVNVVINLYKKRPGFVESILSSQEKLTRELLSAIKSGNAALMIRIIRKGEKNLENLGVVSEFSKSIIREIEASGGAAKICGGGGITRGTGVILVYHRNKKVVERIANDFGYPWFTVILGTEGVKVENYE